VLSRASQPCLAHDNASCTHHAYCLGMTLHPAQQCTNERVTRPTKSIPDVLGACNRSKHRGRLPRLESIENRARHPVLWVPPTGPARAPNNVPERGHRHRGRSAGTSGALACGKQARRQAMRVTPRTGSGMGCSGGAKEPRVLGHPDRRMNSERTVPPDVPHDVPVRESTPGLVVLGHRQGNHSPC